MTDHNPKRDPKIDINVNLGGLFQNLGALLSAINDLAERAGAEGATAQGGELKFGKDSQLRGVYGFSIRSGIGGKPRVQPFGNIRPTPQGPEVDEAREPLVDLFDEGAEILLVAELPGADQADIAVELHGDILAIEVGGARRYAKELLLPAPVDPDSLRQSYRNGILEIRLKKL